MRDIVQRCKIQPYNFQGNPKMNKKIFYPLIFFLKIFFSFFSYHNKFLKLAQRNRSIISPVPGFATHCINGFLAPYRDWSRIQ